MFTTGIKNFQPTLKNLKLSSANSELLHISSSPLLVLNPFPNDTFYSSKLNEFAVDNFKFDENGRKFFRLVENIVGKGEIAHYEQFLLFPVFSKGLYYSHVKTRVCLGKG